jgi:serine/threonine protein phosphatase 1
MRYLAVGDIHGCSKALTTLAAFVPFQSDDLIVTLGDYVNRGPDTRGVVNWLINFGCEANLIALRGNHEVMMLQARDHAGSYHDWIEAGGNSTLASYSSATSRGSLTDVPNEHWKFLVATRRYFETESHFFVHANAYPDFEMAEQPDFMLYWEKFDDPAPHCSGKVMVCGHTPQRSGRPRNIGHAVCIDTWAYGGGWLTCLDLATGRYWQANERGETRVDWLDEP